MQSIVRPGPLDADGDAKEIVRRACSESRFCVTALPFAAMEHVRWSHRPDVDAPVLILAFEGWNDAGDAASSAIRYLRDHNDFERFADIDPEVFFDFTESRPEIRVDDEGERVIRWPRNEFMFGRLPGSDRDVLLMLGTEPQLRWRTFCEAIDHVVEELGVDLVVSFGALLAEVAHSRPVSVVGSSQDVALAAELGLASPRYEGPTGIVGVLNAALEAAGRRAVSLWAAVPTYVPSAQSPKATMALVDRCAALLDASLVTTDLEIATAAYERQINELVAEDDETMTYVAALEERHDDDDQVFPTGVSLIEEVERFLRDRPDD